MKKKSTLKNKKNPLKLVKDRDAQVLNLIEKIEKSTERRLAGFVQELVKLKKNQVKLQEKQSKLAKSNKKAEIKRKTKSKPKTELTLKNSPKPKKSAKKKKQNPFRLVKD